MSYLVFARKYRPQTFAEILGQDPIVTTLTNAIRQRRIAQAYLFTGPRGTGKTSTARIFAKALNCGEGPTVTPCLSCERCQEIAEGRSMDILEIDGASNRGIDQIRTLRELAKFTPASGAFKVYIIDEVHQITPEGFNALLKTLEEPPPHVLFILATTAPHKVPPTILSRCQRYDFRRLSLEVIVGKLKGIASEENLQITEEALVGIARSASGSLRDAESILDQIAAYTAGPIRAEDIQALLGAIDEDVFVQAISAISRKEPVRLLSLVAEAANAGTDLHQWVVSFLSFLRNLLVAKVGAGPLGFEDLGEESIRGLNRLAEGFSVGELTAMAQVMTSCVETMRRVGEPRIPLEIALVRLSIKEPLASVTELIQRLEDLDERIKEDPGSGVLKQAPISQVQSPLATSRASLIRLEQVTALWPKLLAEIQTQKASVAAYLSQSWPISVEGSDPPRLVVGFLKGFEFHREALDRYPTRQLISKTLESLLGSPILLIFQMVESLPEHPTGEPVNRSVAGPGEGPPSRESPTDPSVVDSVLKLFEGRIVPEAEDP